MDINLIVRLVPTIGRREENLVLIDGARSICMTNIHGYHYFGSILACRSGRIFAINCRRYREYPFTWGLDAKSFSYRQ